MPTFLKKVKVLRTLVLSSILAVCSLAPYAEGQTPPQIPAQYQDAYNAVNSNLTSFGASLNTSAGASSSVLYSSQLQTATSDLTTKLLGANYYQVAVLSELNAQQALGVKAITFHINFPSIYAPFVNDSATYQAYINFYTQLVTEIHSRGMKVIIENTSSSPFPGTSATTFTPYLQTLDWPTYMAQRAQFAATIATLFQPDYLVVLTEPDTEAANTGQPNANTVSGGTQLVQGIINSVQAAGASNVQLSAGCGTWNPAFLQFIQSFSTLQLPLIDMHIYPVNKNNLPNALSAISIIQAAGKQPSMSEFWSYKESDSDYTSNIPYTTIFARDVYSFWESTDIAFINTMVNFAKSSHFSFISPFWSHYFGAYLDYNTYSGQSDNTVITAESTAASNANQVGAVTPTGLAWESLLIPSPDTAAPLVPAPPAVKGYSQTQVNLVWQPTTDNVGVAAYNVYRNNALIGTVSSPQSFLDSSAAANTTYSYTVAAFDAVGNMSPQSAPTVVTTYPYADKTPPSTPLNLQGSSPQSSQFALTWTASTDNVGVKGYDIYKGTTASNLPLYSSSAVNSFKDQGLTAGQTYYYQVDAYDAAGNHSGKSAVLTAVMPGMRVSGRR